MENPGVIISILKNIKTDEDIVRYCSTDKKIRKVCKEYSKQIFGRSYEDIVYKVLIKHTFPTLHLEISFDDLYLYYKNSQRIWNELNKIKRFGSVPMCRTVDEFDYYDKDDNVIDPSDPRNVKYIAPYHKAIIEGAKKITFVFFRTLNKLPTNIFTLSYNQVITPFHFIQLSLKEKDLDDKINDNSENILHGKYYRPIWEKYINDPYWKTPENAKYYPSLTLDEELKKVSNNTTCEDYPCEGFRRTELSKFIEKYLNFDHPVMEIDFST